MTGSIPFPVPHFTLLHELQLFALRGEPKSKIGISKSKNKLGHIQKHFDLESDADRRRMYRLFVRQSITNPAVFSVGLTLINPTGDLILCRYNSDHHGHRNILEKQKLPPGFHCHIATQRYIAAELDADGYAEMREDYSNVDEALLCMVRDCSISGIFPKPTQDDLFQ